MEQEVGLIGFGEAGSTFALAGDWAAAAHVYDIKTESAATREAMLAAYAQAGQGSVTGFWRVLEGLIPDQDRSMVFGLRGG